MSLTYSIYQPVAKLLHNPVHLQAAPQLSKKKCQPKKARKRLHNITTASNANKTPTPNSARPSTLSQPVAPQNLDIVAAQIVRDHVTTNICMTGVVIKTRNGQTCRKCAKEDCKGKRGVDLCVNPCQDCRDVECPGRNPQWPTQTCVTAWDVNWFMWEIDSIQFVICTLSIQVILSLFSPMIAELARIFPWHEPRVKLNWLETVIKWVSGLSKYLALKYLGNSQKRVQLLVAGKSDGAHDFSHKLLCHIFLNYTGMQQQISTKLIGYLHYSVG